MSGHEEWRVSEVRASDDTVMVHAANGRFVADVDRPEDANLIAAAPELLECVKALAALESEDGGRSFPSRELCEQARAAISKAQGQTAKAVGGEL